MPLVIRASSTQGKEQRWDTFCLIKGFVSMFRKDRLTEIRSEPSLLKKQERNGFFCICYSALYCDLNGKEIQKKEGICAYNATVHFAVQSKLTQQCKKEVY